MTTTPSDCEETTRAVPATILTGFLGAGKTTLLNRIINGTHGLRVAVLVNDFGSINIDAELVVGIEGGGDVISLMNGCVCCNIRDDLLAAVQRVMDVPEPPDCIVLEASGIADPSGIAATFLGAHFRNRIRLDSILCVMDASQIFKAPEMMVLKLRQIAFADMLILNKADLVSREEIGRIKAWLDEHFHRYRLVEATRGDVPLEILLACDRFDAARLDAGHEQHDCDDVFCQHHHHDAHAEAFSTWSYETDQPLSLDTLRYVAATLPTSAYRCKGIAYSADFPDRRVILQVVGKRADISLGDGWRGQAPRTRVVVIGARGGIDSEALQEKFARCSVGPR